MSIRKDQTRKHVNEHYNLIPMLCKRRNNFFLILLTFKKVEEFVFKTKYAKER